MHAKSFYVKVKFILNPPKNEYTISISCYPFGREEQNKSDFCLVFRAFTVITDQV